MKKEIHQNRNHEKRVNIKIYSKAHEIHRCPICALSFSPFSKWRIWKLFYVRYSLWILSWHCNIMTVLLLSQLFSTKIDEIRSSFHVAEHWTLNIICHNLQIKLPDAWFQIKNTHLLLNWIDFVTCIIQ